MIFTAEENGHEYHYSIWAGNVEYSCADLPAGKQTYATLEALQNAVRKYDLSLKKQFTNRTAYFVNHLNMNIEVSVTSIEGIEFAWISSRLTWRQKVSRDSLYANKEEVLRVITEQNETQERIRGLWARLARWEPQS